MAGSTLVSSGAHAHAAAEHAVLPVPAALHRTLRESSGSTADDDQPVEFVQRERQPAIDSIANEEKRGESRVPGNRSRDRRARPMSESKFDRGRVRQESDVLAITRAGAGGADGPQHEGHTDGRTGGGRW